MVAVCFTNHLASEGHVHVHTRERAFQLPSHDVLSFLGDLCPRGPSPTSSPRQLVQALRLYSGSSKATESRHAAHFTSCSPTGRYFRNKRSTRDEPNTYVALRNIHDFFQVRTKVRATNLCHLEAVCFGLTLGARLSLLERHRT